MKYSHKHQDLLEPILGFLHTIKGKLRLLGVKCSSLIKADEYKKQQLVNYLNNPKKLKETIE
jgi:hypothetical protein